MLGISEIEKIIGMDVSLSTEMQTAMQRWLNEYLGKPYWISETVPTLGIPSGIAEELARLSLLEFEFVGAGNDARGEFIGAQLKKALDDIQDDLELALAIGGMFPKPYVKSDGGIGVEWIPQNRVFPLSDEAGDVTGGVFIAQNHEGDLTYTRLEIQTIKNRVYRIRNYAFVSKSVNAPFARSINVFEVPGWENVATESAWGDVEYPGYAVFRVPGKNKVDLDSPLGQSVFAGAEELIKNADEQYGRFLWEFEATEAAIHADSQAFRSVTNADGTVTNTIPKGKERLYRMVQNVGKMGDGGYFEKYSPDIRDVAQINGLNQILMQIETKCGLVRGTLSNDKISDSYTNELELKLARNRGENTTNRIQKAFKQTIIDLCMAMNTLCDIYGLVPGEIDPDKIEVKFGDSIVQDDTTRLEQMRQDVNDGIIPKWMYIAAKYGKTELEAKALAAEGTDTGTPPENMLFGADTNTGGEQIQV